ncbi:MAG: NAD-dependent epimerase/dehydratase family protein [Thaumarchaeota archaeon]|nr:NAD-dependent epimerase/dehydratase family protein [Nitrososphaerota archaeon]
MLDFYRNRLVAVTGSTGLNGSYIVKALVDAGARVRAITHKRPSNEFTKLADEVLQADLMDARQASEAVRGAEIVMHAAGITGGAPPLLPGPSNHVGFVAATPKANSGDSTILRYHFPKPQPKQSLNIVTAALN